MTVGADSPLDRRDLGAWRSGPGCKPEGVHGSFQPLPPASSAAPGPGRAGSGLGRAGGTAGAAPAASGDRRTLRGAAQGRRHRPGRWCRLQRAQAQAPTRLPGAGTGTGCFCDGSFGGEGLPRGSGVVVAMKHVDVRRGEHVTDLVYVCARGSESAGLCILYTRHVHYIRNRHIYTHVYIMCTYISITARIRRYFYI